MNPHSENPQDQIDRLLFSLSSLNDLSETLIATEDFNTTMRALLHLVLGELTISRGALCLFDRDQGTLYVETARGLETPVPAISMKEAWVEALIRENRPLTRDDLARLTPALPEQLSPLPAFFLVPLIAEHHLVGVLCVSERFKQFPYTKYECLLLMTMARQIAIAIYNHQLLEETKSIRTLFKRYVSDHVADMLLQSEANLSLGGIYRDVVVVFTDLRHFTRMQENQGPEETVTMLNAYYEQMMAVIHRHNGTITRMSGDGLMILYGAPLPFEDDLDRAMETVLDMRDALSGLNDERQAVDKEPLSMGVGISMGRVLAGNIGSTQRMEYTVIGEPVNLAARLVDIAGSDQILVSEDVFHAVKDRLAIGYVRTIRVKGQALPVNIYELKGRCHADAEASPPAQMPYKEGEITLTVPMWPTIELTVSQTAAAAASYLALDDMQIEEIRLAVIEACINAVEHSASADGKIHVIIRLLEASLEIVIQDFGEGFDVAPLRDHIADRKAGTGKLIKRGWGLTLIESLMDQVDMTSSAKGTAVRMVKLRNKRRV